MTLNLKEHKGVSQARGLSERLCRNAKKLSGLKGLTEGEASLFQ